MYTFSFAIICWLFGVGTGGPLIGQKKKKKKKNHLLLLKFIHTEIYNMLRMRGNILLVAHAAEKSRLACFLVNN